MNISDTDELYHCKKVIIWYLEINFILKTRFGPIRVAADMERKGKLDFGGIWGVLGRFGAIWSDSGPFRAVSGKFRKTRKIPTRPDPNPQFFRPIFEGLRPNPRAQRAPARDSAPDGALGS